MSETSSDELRQSSPGAVQYSMSKDEAINQMESGKEYQIQNLLTNVKAICQQCKCSCHTKYLHQQGRQIQSIKLKFHFQESQYNFNKQMLQNRLDQIKYENECILQENVKLKQFLTSKSQEIHKLEKIMQKYENKIRNQESLIDEYRCSLEEQITLQKEVIKAAYLEKQYHMRAQFEKALKNMEINFRKQLRQNQKRDIAMEYTQDLKFIKKFCSKLIGTQKMDLLLEKQNKSLKPNGSTKKLNGCSSYSTIDK